MFKSDPSNNPFVGPFSSRLSGLNGVEIFNADGETFCWVAGEEAGQFILFLLNLAYGRDSHAAKGRPGESAVFRGS